jgi:hypothetical protein
VFSTKDTSGNSRGFTLPTKGHYLLVVCFHAVFSFYGSLNYTYEKQGIDYLGSMLEMFTTAGMNTAPKIRPITRLTKIVLMKPILYSPIE